MKFCEVCKKSSMDGVKFAKKNSTFRYFGKFELCEGCELDLKATIPNRRLNNGVQSRDETPRKMTPPRTTGY